MNLFLIKGVPKWEGSVTGKPRTELFHRDLEQAKRLLQVFVEDDMITVKRRLQMTQADRGFFTQAIKRKQEMPVRKGGEYEDRPRRYAGTYQTDDRFKELLYQNSRGLYG